MKKVIIAILASAFLFNGCLSALRYGRDYKSPCGYSIRHVGDNQPFTSLGPQYRAEIENGNTLTMNSYYILSMFPESKKRVEASKNDLGNVVIDNVGLVTSYVVSLVAAGNGLYLSFNLKPLSAQNTNAIIITTGVAAVVFFTAKIMYDLTSYINNVNKSIEEFNKACADETAGRRNP